jgi:L-lactate dehydrogenase complex protein LldG
MSRVARNAILLRLEEALTIAPVPGAAAPPPVECSPLSDAASIPLQNGPADWERLKSELAASRAELELVDSLPKAHKFLRRLARELEIKTAARWRHPRLERLGLDKALADAGVTLVEPDAEGYCQGLREVDLGVTAADAAFLDTGSIAVSSGMGKPRSISLLPRIHLAVLEAEDLLPGLCAWPELIRRLAAKEGLPSAAHLISGPSGTADIELVYSQGVHGPLALRVLALAPGWDKS